VRGAARTVPGPLYVLTHRTGDQPAPEAGFTFVSGLDDALTQATEKAGGDDVAIAAVRT